MQESASSDADPCPVLFIVSIKGFLPLRQDKLQLVLISLCLCLLTSGRAPAAAAATATSTFLSAYAHDCLYNHHGHYAQNDNISDAHFSYILISTLS